MRNGLLGLLLLFCVDALSQKRIVVLGSSTALGASATSYDSSWAGRLQALYRKNTAVGNPDTIVTAMGGYGYTTYREIPNSYTPSVTRHSIDPANNANAALAMNPDIVIINLPSNDVASYAQSWISPPYNTKETMDNLRAMYNFFLANGVKCFVTTSQPRNDLDVSQRQLQLNLVDSIINNFGMFTINYWDDLVVPGGSNLLKDEVRNLGGSDQLYHLNNTGHRYIFERVKNKNIFHITTPTPSPVYTNIPSKIEAENYSAMSGVQMEPTTDVGGGSNLGYIDQNDWMDYNINATSAGTYNTAMRVAAFSSGGQLQIRNQSGTVLATVTVPQTGGWQVWQSINTSINLPSGNHTLKIISTAPANWNINWLDFTLLPPPPPPPGYASVPGKIEAENYAAMSGVQQEPTADSDGGQNVGYVDSGDWMDYNINASSAGTYSVSLRVAAMDAGGQIQIRKSDGSVLATVAVPATGGWQVWQTVNTSVSLASGIQTLRVISTALPNWNINWINFVLNSSPPSSNYPSVPCKIEAEAYSAQSGIQLEPTTDLGGGQNVGYIGYGDWMDYQINIPSQGSYKLNLRIASAETGGQTQVKKSDGTVLFTYNVPNTGGWQIWQTISGNFVLPPGNQIIRLISNSAAGWNVNWLDFQTNTIVPAPVATRIEAENFTSMTGVQTENTSDQGGGLNVGYIDYSDWMAYSYNAPVTGNHNISFRVAAPDVGTELKVYKSGGVLLATVNIPQTGGWQQWQTVNATIQFTQGIQTFYVVSTRAAGWNFNWMEITPPASSPLAARNQPILMQSIQSGNFSVNVFPNPVINKLSLIVDNPYTGTMHIEVIDLNGKVLQSLSLQKSAAGKSVHSIYVGYLPSAQYILRVSIKDWSRSVVFHKQN